MLVPRRLEADRGDGTARHGTARENGQSDLGRAEGDGGRRAHRRTRDLAGRGDDAGRHVDRDDWLPGAVDALDHPRHVLTRRVPQADPEQGIDDDVGFAQLAEPFDHDDLAAALAQDARTDAAVSAVVPGAADDRHAPREALGDQIGHGGARPLHQLVERAGVSLLGPPGLLCREERLHHSVITTATAAASSRECVIESSMRPAPIRSATCAVRPLSSTPGFGRPRISISRHVK